MTVNRDPSSDSQLSTKKYVDDQLDINTKVRFNETLENYLKVSLGNDTYKLTKDNKIQLTDNTINKTGINGLGVLPNWNIICNDENGNAYLEFNITIRKNDDTNFHYDDPIRLVNIGLAFCFKEGSLSTTLGSDIEMNKFCGQVSTTMEMI